MGFISKTFDLKKMARKLSKATPSEGKPIAVHDGQRLAVQDLDDYIYRQLLLPIIRREKVPTAGLDFGKISVEDIDELTEVLHNCETFELFHLGDAFTSMPPAAARNSTFI